MTEDLIKYLQMALILQGVDINYKVLEHIIRTHKIVEEKEGEFRLMDATKLAAGFKETNGESFDSYFSKSKTTPHGWQHSFNTY